MKRTGRGNFQAVLRSGRKTGRVEFDAGPVEVILDHPVYFIPPPDPADPPTCSRQVIADYSFTLDPLDPLSPIDFVTAGNSLGAAVDIFFLPLSLPVISGRTVEAVVVVEGSSLAEDLVDVALTVDDVTGGILLRPGDTAGGTAFDLGDFPATANAERDEGMPAVWGAMVRVRVEGDAAVVSGRVLASSPCPGDGAGFRIAPYLTHFTGAAIDLRWETDREAPAYAAFGGPDGERVATARVSRRRLYDGYDWSFPRRFNSFFYSATLDGLSVGSEAWWRVPATAEPAGPGRFRFGARPGQPFTFGQLGDTQVGHSPHAGIIGLMLGGELDFYLHTGDLVQNSNLDAEWRAFFGIEAPLMRQAPFFPALGNHDQQRFDTFFGRYFSGRHWSSFDWGNAHFVLIDSYWPVEHNSEQYRWLAADLAAAAARPETRFTFVAMHNPIWTIFPYGYHPSGYLLEPLFESSGVDAVFAGHIHLYERSNVNGRVYIDSSGGGGSMRDPVKDPALNPHYVLSKSIHHYLRVEVEADHFTIHAIDLEGNEIDQVTRFAD